MFFLFVLLLFGCWNKVVILNVYRMPLSSDSSSYSIPLAAVSESLENVERYIEKLNELSPELSRNRQKYEKFETELVENPSPSNTLSATAQILLLDAMNKVCWILARGVFCLWFVILRYVMKNDICTYLYTYFCNKYTIKSKFTWNN